MNQDESRQWILEPVPIRLPLLGPETTRSKFVACGRVHSIICTDKEGGLNDTQMKEILKDFQFFFLKYSALETMLMANVDEQ